MINYKIYILYNRKGNYKYYKIHEALTENQILVFNKSEYYDLQLYEFAEKIFLNRIQYTSCINL